MDFRPQQVCGYLSSADFCNLMYPGVDLLKLKSKAVVREEKHKQRKIKKDHTKQGGSRAVSELTYVKNINEGCPKTFSSKIYFFHKTLLII